MGSFPPEKFRKTSAAHLQLLWSTLCAVNVNPGPGSFQICLALSGGPQHSTFQTVTCGTKHARRSAVCAAQRQPLLEWTGSQIWTKRAFTMQPATVAKQEESCFTHTCPRWWQWQAVVVVVVVVMVVKAAGVVGAAVVAVVGSWLVCRREG